MSTKDRVCFIIMPITTPSSHIDTYKEDADHFPHTVDHLFTPAITKAGFLSIPPKAKGSDIIQAEIIKRLATADLVLCDMSILNPNVFFEFGIRVALNRPVALVVDDKTTTLPFDTSIINYHRYKSSLDPWTLSGEISSLATHIQTAYESTPTANALWKYFGIAQTGVFKPGEAQLGDKIDLVLRELSGLKTQLGSSPSSTDIFFNPPKRYSGTTVAQMMGSVAKEYREKSQNDEIKEQLKELTKIIKKANENSPEPAA